MRLRDTLKCFWPSLIFYLYGHRTAYFFLEIFLHMEKENIQLNLWNLMKHIWLSNCVYSFGPGFKPRGLERNELTDAGFETMTVCSDLLLFCAFKKKPWQNSKFCRIPNGYKKTQHLVKPRVYYTVHKENHEIERCFGPTFVHNYANYAYVYLRWNIQ
jgi:hypothetical protein